MDPITFFRIFKMVKKYGKSSKKKILVPKNLFRLIPFFRWTYILYRIARYSGQGLIFWPFFSWIFMNNCKNGQKKNWPVISAFPINQECRYHRPTFCGNNTPPPYKRTGQKKGRPSKKFFARPIFHKTILAYIDTKTPV